VAELFYGIANISTIAQLTLRTSVAEGTLEIVLDRHEIKPPPVNIVYPQGRFVPQKVRALVDFAMPRLRECLALIETQCSAP
jgi:DNA-binding transcriptional LysR family regulator